MRTKERRPQGAFLLFRISRLQRDFGQSDPLGLACMKTPRRVPLRGVLFSIKVEVRSDLVAALLRDMLEGLFRAGADMADDVGGAQAPQRKR